MNAFSALDDGAVLFRRTDSGRRQELAENRWLREPDGTPTALGPENGFKDAGSVCRQVASAERRRLPRHTQRLPLALSVFNRAGFQGAWLINFSQDGICAESAQQLLPGTSVQLRIDATVPMDDALEREKTVFPGLRTMALGEVKWCRSLGVGCSPRFSIGIRYYPYY
ncbi:MAG: hypothetical protein R6V84_04555 [Desulfobacterales bacterium]